MNKQLVETIARNLKDDEQEILNELQTKEECYCAIKLSSEEGETLITLHMSDDEIEKSITEAVNEVFESKGVIDVFISQSREIISFTII